MIPTAQPVFHFKPKNPSEFEAPKFPVYFPDPVRSGRQYRLHKLTGRILCIPLASQGKGSKNSFP